MAATQVQPLQLREPTCKLLLNMHQRTLQHIGTALAMAVAMEAFDISRQLFGQLVGCHAKAGARRTGIIESRTHLRILWIDTQADRSLPPYPFVEPLVLRQRVKREVAGTAQYLVELRIGIGRRIGMGLAAELLKGQSGFTERAGRRRTDILTENRERLPKGKGLEGENYLDVGLTGHIGNESQVSSELRLFYNINRCIHRGCKSTKNL